MIPPPDDGDIDWSEPDAKPTQPEQPEPAKLAA